MLWLVSASRFLPGNAISRAYTDGLPGLFFGIVRQINYLYMTQFVIFPENGRTDFQA